MKRYENVQAFRKLLTVQIVVTSRCNLFLENFPLFHLIKVLCRPLLHQLGGKTEGWARLSLPAGRKTQELPPPNGPRSSGILSGTQNHNIRTTSSSLCSCSTQVPVPCTTCYSKRKGGRERTPRWKTEIFSKLPE